jgi:hypothetical protein
VIGHVYYFHRWVFRYGDLGTSPTYSATPLVWQVAKYLIVALLAIVCGISLLRSRRPAVLTGGFVSGLGLLLLLLFVTTVVCVAEAPDQVGALVRTWFFLPLVMAMAMFHDDRTLSRLGRVCTWLTLYHVGFSAVQIAAFLIWDRLPSLAYPNGGLVRFGGGLDDPNSFGLLLILPILALMADRSRSRRTRFVLLLVLLGLLVLTFSYSAAAAFAVGVAVFLLLLRDLNQATTLLLAGLAAAWWALHSDVFAQVVGFKSASALSRFGLGPVPVERFGIADYASRVTWLDLLQGAPGLDVRTENSYLLVFADHGLPAAILLVALVVATVVRGVSIVRAMRRVDSPATRPFAVLAAFEVAFAVGALALPHFSVFPTNMAFWVVAMMLWMTPKPTASSSTHPLVRSMVSPNARLTTTSGS